MSILVVAGIIYCYLVKQLSEKLNIFCEFVVPFSESTLSFEYFETRKKFYNSVISEDIDSERRAYLDA